MAIIRDDNKIRVTGKAKPGQRVIRISNGSDMIYLPIGIAGMGGGSMSFYQCASYDDGETIPAYTNIVISGLTSPAEANGTYVVNDIEAEGTDRKWSNGDYTISNSNYTWYIHKSAVTPNKINALYYAEVLPATTGEGTVENPKYWDSVITDTENRWATPIYNTGSFAISGNKCNFYVKLTAGTPYQMGVSANGKDNVVRLYDLAGEVLIEDDGNSADINGITCSDSFSFTPTVTGVYRFEAGAWSTAVGDVQAVCFPAPELANAPTKTEPWEIEWTVGGAEEGAFIITNAGWEPAIGKYTPSTETYDGNTVWTNEDTGAVWKATFSGSSWRWFLYPDATSTSYKYVENNYGSFATPWDVTTQWGNSNQPYPTFAKSTGYNATGTLSITEVAIAERPATGKQVWTGCKVTQDTETLKWTVADTVTTGLQVKGVPPVVGYIYSADTTIQIANIVEDAPGQMVCLAHFDGFANNTAPSFVDATDTCIITVQNQSSIATQDSYAKFGNGRWGGNYRNLPYEGCFNIIGLPEIAGDFTIEFWFYYTGYSDFGGTFVYTYDANDYGEAENVVEIKGANLDKNHPQYRYKEWVHRAFVRKGTTVTEYINGVKVGTSEFTVALGGSRGLSITGGGVREGAYDVRNYIDEFAIFSYAKYNLDFTPPVAPYPDIPSGLHTPDTQVGEVTVSGIKSIPWANSASYVLTNPDYDERYPYLRVWATADKKWYIYFDDLNGCWSISNTTYWEDFNHIEVAYITNDSADSQSGIEPIGNSGWRDAMGNKVKVIANS